MIFFEIVRTSIIELLNEVRIAIFRWFWNLVSYKFFVKNKRRKVLLTRQTTKLLKDVSDCHCIINNTIEVTYRSKYKLIAQMFLVDIDFNTLRLIDQSEVLISFVFIFRSFVIVLFNTFTRWQSCSLHSWMRLSLSFNSCIDVIFIEC